MKRIATLSLACAFLPVFAQAQATFTEIMYDPAGTDSESGGEWVEMLVTGTENLDFSLWKIGDKTGSSGSFSNRTITHVIGESEVSPGEYAVIAKNADHFRSAFPSYSGPLFQSTFSLTDEDTLHLLDESLLVIDEVSWVSSEGGKGDGNTLQKVGEEWTNGTPTPGGPFEGGTEEGTSEEPKGKGGESSHHGPAPLITTPPFRPLIVHIGGDRLTAVENPLHFEAKFENEPTLGRPEFLWSMGDGTILKRRLVEYTYGREGVYVVVLTVTYGSQKAVARATVKVVKPEILLERDGDEVRIVNASSDEVNLYRWEVKGGNATFTFLGDTILLPGKSLALDSDIMGISDLSGTVELINPGGERYASLAIPASLSGEVRGSVVFEASPKPVRTSPPPVAPLQKITPNLGESEERAQEPVSEKASVIVVEKPLGTWEKVKQFLGKLF